MQLFDRVIELIVGDIEITGLDIAFEVEKSLQPEPNICDITVYNLGAENRQRLSDRYR